MNINGEQARGDIVLDDVKSQIARYCILPGEHAYVAATLWIAATHVQAAWEHATRLVVKSPMKRCGKTRVLEIITELAYQPIPTANISVAALVHGISAEDPPTLILDEADAIFAKRRGDRSESAEALRGIINTGFSKGFPYLRYDVASRSNVASSTFCMVAIAAIGDLPDTIEDRAVVLTMQRRAPGESVAQFRRRKAVPSLRQVRDRLHAWASSLCSYLLDAEPDVPAEDRTADVWEPLIAIADAAGGDWPERARHACTAFSKAAEDESESSLGPRLLEDIKAIFDDLNVDTIFSADLAARLRDIEEGPWAAYSFDRAIAPSQVASMLRPYGIKSRQLRIGKQTKKGYLKAEFVAAWTRYTHVRETGETGETTLPEPPGFESETEVSESVSNGPDFSETGRFESEFVAANVLVSDVSPVPAESRESEQLICWRCRRPIASGEYCAQHAEAWRHDSFGPAEAKAWRRGGPEAEDTNTETLAWCPVPGCIQIVRPQRPCPEHGTEAAP